MNNGIIYLIQPSEMVETERYKIGMSSNPNLDDENLEEIYIDNFNEIKEEFKHYKEDVEFGGMKQLIKVYINEHHNDNIIRDDYVIKFKYIYDKELQETNIYIDDINDYSYNHIKNIINKQFIQNGHIYDLNDKSFQKNINQCKKIYNDVILSKETTDKISQDSININKNSIEYLFKIDCLINNIPCSSYSKNYFILDPYNCNIEFRMYTLNGKLYDKLYLREYIPYQIRFDDNLFCILNRDYNYIGLDGKRMDDFKSDVKHLFKDDTTCWTDDNNNNNVNMKKIIKTYEELTRYKKCLNPNENTKNILSLF